LLSHLTHSPQAQLHCTAPSTPFHRVREVLGSMPRTALWERETPYAGPCFVSVNES
jgi:hypothetical protein